MIFPERDGGFLTGLDPTFSKPGLPGFQAHAFHTKIQAPEKLCTPLPGTPLSTWTPLPAPSCLCDSVRLVWLPQAV